MNADERRARFRELHEREQLFLMPNPWDAGSARILAAAGFEALATTSAGFAWTLGQGRPAGDARRARRARRRRSRLRPTCRSTSTPSAAIPDDPGGVAETVRLLAEAGAAGCSIEDYDPATGAIDDVGLAAERVAIAAEAAHGLDEPMVLTGRAENHIRGVDDLDDTIARLIAYRDAGADCVYAPGLTDIGDIKRGRRGGRRAGERARARRRRRRSPSSPRRACAASRPAACWREPPTARCTRARRSCSTAGTSTYAAGHIPRDVLRDALGG